MISDVKSLVVTFDPGDEGRAMLERTFTNLASIAFLTDSPEPERTSILSSTDALLCWIPARELKDEEWDEIGEVEFMQLVSAGADQVPFSKVPSGLPVASNVGAYAEPMAEHVLAMALALARRLPLGHEKLRRGDFDQRTPNRSLRSAACGILGFGGIGKATARLMRALGMEIYAVNRSGQSDEPADFLGTMDDLERVLSSSDVVVVALPLSEGTRKLIGERELEWMKPDAILINVARGEIIDEEALYEHLLSHPDFMAGIDAWWVEPLRHGEFRVDHPFLDLPNVLGSPHNSAIVPGAIDEGMCRAAENVRRFLNGESVSGLVRSEDRTS